MVLEGKPQSKSRHVVTMVKIIASTTMVYGVSLQFVGSTGLPIFPLKTSPPPRETHLPWTKKVMFKTTKKGNIGTPVQSGIGAH